MANFTISTDLQALADATSEYVKAEKTRIENEVAVLKAVLSGRTAGSGIQSQSIAQVTSVANADLFSYLQLKPQ